MNDHFCTAFLTVSGDPGTELSTNPVEEFGHFVNATLLHETRLFIIATLTLKIQWKLLLTTQKLLYEQKATSNILMP